jgi:hypothetical protein
MGLRLEVILAFLIVGIIAATVMLKINSSGIEVNTMLKELEFTNTTFTEVNTEKLQGHVYGTYGTRLKGVLSLENLKYNSETISELTANKGTYKGEILYLYGDVLLKEKDGYTYNTQQANYNQQTDMLYITAPFIGTRDKNIIKGKTLEYNTRIKKASGTKIDSVLYTTEK